MCGIAGILSASERTDAIMRKMTDAISHRGPDADGLWHGQGISLGHRRLSILDLSQAGAQPMTSRSGRYVIVYNGEIYNHLALRERLTGPWQGHSDTETILALIEQVGFESALTQLVGMFAIALWDVKESRLHLARDRMGEKPLYYGWAGQDIVFASELKAITAHPRAQKVLSQEAIFHYMRYSYVPAPLSIYEGIFKLKPGQHICFDQESLRYHSLPEPHTYWSYQQAVSSGRAALFEGSDDEAKSLFHDTLSQAVKGQMISDVPLGCFLSGGIDSSLIASVMQAQSSKKVKSFSIGFKEAGFNEAAHAKDVAAHLGLDHHEAYVSEQDALSVIPKLPHIYCEPFADASQIPTYLVSQLAKTHITVALSGDGGDELMGGYNRYSWALKLAKIQTYTPSALSLMAGHMIEAMPAPWLHHLTGFVPQMNKVTDRGLKAHKFAHMLKAKDFQSLYQQLVSQWAQPQDALSSADVFADRSANLSSLSLGPVDYMMAQDSLTYLPDDILVKVDRAAMANSLEGRIPFLDHRLIELSWHMPLSIKIREGKGKWLLRSLLYDYVPKQLVDRPKAGFAVPLAKWLRGDLREWAESLLDEQALNATGLFDTKKLRAVWQAHLSGQHDYQYQLWGPLMLLAWQNEVS